MGYKLAVVGATGNVGREMLRIIEERGFPVDEIVALASERSAGKQVSFGDETILDVQDLEKFKFKGIDIVLSSPGAKVSATFAPRAARAGAIVIDNTSQFRMDPEVPLVVPEVNAESIERYKNRNIISNPNCSPDFIHRSATLTERGFLSNVMTYALKSVIPIIFLMF